MQTSKLKAFCTCVLIGVFSVNANAGYYVAMPSPDVGVIWIYCSPPKKMIRHKQTIVYRNVVNDSGCQSEACDIQWRSRQPLVFYTNPPVYSESYMYGNDSNDINYDTGTADGDW